jgi:hypothetical protein
MRTKNKYCVVGGGLLDYVSPLVISYHDFLVLFALSTCGFSCIHLLYMEAPFAFNDISINYKIKLKSLKTLMISTFKTSEQAWKNAIEKPSRPGALSPFIAFTTFLTSSSKSLSNQPTSVSKMESKERPSTNSYQLPYSVYKF